MKNILLIDDDRTLNRRNKASLIVAFGESVRILVAYTTKQAIEFAKKYQIHVFVIDIFGLGDGMDGIELAEFLRNNEYPYPIPMIIASKEGNDTYKNEAHKRMKFYDFITKPYAIEELVGQIQSAIKSADYRPNPFFEIQCGNLPYHEVSNTISHIEKVFDKRYVDVFRRDSKGKILPTHTVPVESFKSFVEKSVYISRGFAQCNRTTVVNLHWVERYCDQEKCVILQACGTEISVSKDFRETIRRLVPVY